MTAVKYFLVNKTNYFSQEDSVFGFQTCLIVSGRRMWVEVAGTAVLTLLVSLLLLYRHVTKSFRYPQHALQRNSEQIFPGKELHGLSPNFHIHVSVSDLYIPTIGLPVFCCRKIGGPILWIYKSLTDTWMIKFWLETAQLLFWKYINGIFVAVWMLQLCD